MLIYFQFQMGLVQIGLIQIGLIQTSKHLGLKISYYNLIKIFWVL